MTYFIGCSRDHVASQCEKVKKYTRDLLFHLWCWKSGSYKVGLGIYLFLLGGLCSLLVAQIIYQDDAPLHYWFELLVVLAGVMIVFFLNDLWVVHDY